MNRSCALRCSDERNPIECAAQGGRHARHAHKGSEGVRGSSGSPDCVEWRAVAEMGAHSERWRHWFAHCGRTSLRCPIQEPTCSRSYLIDFIRLYIHKLSIFAIFHLLNFQCLFHFRPIIYYTCFCLRFVLGKKLLWIGNSFTLDNLSTALNLLYGYKGCIKFPRFTHNKTCYKFLFLSGSVLFRPPEINNEWLLRKIKYVCGQK